VGTWSRTLLTLLLCCLGIVLAHRRSGRGGSDSLLLLFGAQRDVVLGVLGLLGRAVGSCLILCSLNIRPAKA
jgi:hypothetical protein